MIKKLGFLICLGLMALGAINLGEATEDFYINNYNINIVVNEDNSYYITENIDLFFKKSRHGINRILPATYKNKILNISDINVSNDNFKVINFFRDYKIKIGNENQIVIGKKNYEISYKYEIGLDNAKKQDLLNYNLIGTAWDTTIKKVTFKILMPKAFNKENLEFYYGKYGSSDKNNVLYNVKGNVITGYTTKSLKPKEGLTVYLPLPNNYFSNAKNLQEGLITGRILFYSLVIGLTILITILWFKYGKNKKLVKVIEFNAPVGMSPADVELLFCGHVTLKGILALALYWENKGYIKIKDRSSKGKPFESKTLRDYQVIKVMDSDETFSSFELYVFNKLFSKAKPRLIELAYLVKEDSKKLQSLIKQQYVKGDEINTHQSMKLNKVIKYLACPLICITPLIIVIAWGMSIAETIIMAISYIMVLGVFYCFAIVLLKNIQLFKDETLSVKIICYTLYILLLLVPIVVGFFITQHLLLTLIEELLLILVILIMNYFILHLPKRSKKYNKIYHKILGYKEFIKAAEIDILEKLISEDTSYYHLTLSYAMVLNLTEVWIAKGQELKSRPRCKVFMNRISSINSLSSYNDLVSIAINTKTSSFRSGGYSGSGAGGGGGSSW